MRYDQEEEVEASATIWSMFFLTSMSHIDLDPE
jgi:hypothetical protein